ncbi:hypothetical protein MCG45_17375 [Clostridium perfringens]|nr:hypothetical protein [Clostridium perfringens]MCH1964598.1 hypothetical protein [Clostridium perfringens]
MKKLESWYKDFNIKEVEVPYSVSRQTEGRKRNKGIDNNKLLKSIWKEIKLWLQS